MVGETWKSDIVRQLKYRDRIQHARFQDLFRAYTNLLNKTHLSSSQKYSSIDSCSSSFSLLQLKKKTGEVPIHLYTSSFYRTREYLVLPSKDFRRLAGHAVELQREINSKLDILEEQHARLSEKEQQLAGASANQLMLQDMVNQAEQKLRTLKKNYDSLLEELRLIDEHFRSQSLKQPTTCVYKDNEQRGPGATMQMKKTSTQSKVHIVRSKYSPPKLERQNERADSTHSRDVRTSFTSPKVFSPIRKLFQKTRLQTVCSLEEDQMRFEGFCVSARVPVRALQVLEAHKQDINALSFNSVDLLATGGTDKVIKLWDIRSGSLNYRATLVGSTEGITCIDFSKMDDRILAASYDKSALLWLGGSATPKLTLTGHSRKVTAARFCMLPHQVATGSADRTIRHWDLHRAACVQVVHVTSYCSDLVCADHHLISGHFDCKIRVWDSRMLGCSQELPAQGKVTSLDISSDHRQLLSCCRDNCLQLVDLRRWSNDSTFFRADGFSCGSDSTRAVISPDGGFLAAGSADGTLYIWNVSTGKLERHLSGTHISAISAVSWSPSGKYVVSVDKDRMAVLWSDI